MRLQHHTLENVVRNLSDVLTPPYSTRQSLRSIIRHYGDNGGIVGGIWCFTGDAAPHLDSRRRCLRSPSTRMRSQSANCTSNCVYRDSPSSSRATGRNRAVICGDSNSHPGSTGFAMFVGILPRRIQFMMVVRMFHGRHLEVSGSKFTDKITDESGLAGVFATDNMNAT